MKSQELKEVFFVGILLICLMLILPARSQARDGLSADMVILSGHIITMDDKNPRAEAVAFRDGKIVAVGADLQIKRLIGLETRVIDAQGKTVTPGFIDAHLHPAPVYTFESRMYLVPLGPAEVKTIEDLIAILRKKADITPKGEWILGTRYEDTKLGRHPTRWDLDKASTEHPIQITHSSGHISVVNTRALEWAKVNKDTPDPPGGGFDKDKNGELTGVCREGAMRVVSGGVVQSGRPFPVPTKEDEMKGLNQCFMNFLSKGITGIGDATTTAPRIKLYQDVRAAGLLPLRVNMMIRDTRTPGLPPEAALVGTGYYNLQFLEGLQLRSGFGDDWLRIGPVKSTFGNSLSGRTCWLYEPYDMINPKTGKRDYYGIPPGGTQEGLDEWVYKNHAMGNQIIIHTNGDREIDMCLDAIERAIKKFPRANHRHRLEHASVLTQKILDRVKALGVVLVLHSYIYEHGDKIVEFGEKRWPMMFPNKTAMEMGIHVAQHSDWGVSAADPMLRIQSLVTRKSKEGNVYGPEQKLSVEQAIRLWTLGGAYASFEENIKGSIEVGKLADVVILSNDPNKVSPDAIKDIQVEKTIVGGKIKYERM